MSEVQNGQTPTPTERAEVLVDRLGERLGHFLSIAGHQLRKTAALAREEAEDIWAEAQNIRRGNHTPTEHGTPPQH
jgi:predicted Zn-dependent protease